MGDKNTGHRLPIRKTALKLIGELGSESNAHGVARIVRSHDSRRKVVWSLLVLLGVGAAISQLSSLVHKYLQYQVVEVSEIQDGLPVEFPSVTVCNIEPISWRKLRLLINNNTTSSSDVRAWLTFLETFSYGQQEPHLRSIRAFRENVGRDAQYVQHSLAESVLHCNFNKQPCLTNFTTSFDGNYYSCFTFNTQPRDPASRLIVHSTGPEYGLSLVMFLDNNEPPLGTYGVYTLDTNILHSAGVRVMVHAPNTLPIPVDHGQDVAPGFSTSISIKPVLHARLPSPYGNCSDTLLRGLNNFTSTYSTCIAVCKQELIARTCRCRSSALPQVPSLEHLPYCGQVPNWRSMVRNVELYNKTQHLPALECEAGIMGRLKNDRGYETDCGCSHPCGELSYQMSTSMSYWPTELYQFDALNKLYGEVGVLSSPLSHAYQLHDSNIKDGVELREQIAQLHAAETGGGGGGHGGGDGDSTQGGAQNRPSDSSPKPATSGSAKKKSDSGGRNPSSTSSPNSSKDSARSPGAPTSHPTPKSSTSTSPPPPKEISLEYSPKHLDNLREASTDIRQNLVRLNVYLENLSVVKFKQMPAYGMEDLFADIGGTLGLWMGVSVLTVMELLELVSRLSYLFLRAEWRPQSGPSGDPKDKANQHPNINHHHRSGSAERESRERSPYGRHHNHYHTSDDPRDRISNGDDSDSEIGGGGGGGGGGGSGQHSNDIGRSGYSYNSNVEFRRGEDEHVRHELFESNGRGHGHAGGGGGTAQSRGNYNGRTRYWRLKRAKNKR